jgi:hypothetical protein
MRFVELSHETVTSPPSVTGNPLAVSHHRSSGEVVVTAVSLNTTMPSHWSPEVAVNVTSFASQMPSSAAVTGYEEVSGNLTLIDAADDDNFE